MMDLYVIFQFFKGRCHGNQIILWKCYQHRLIPLAFVALVIENKLQYHGLVARVNSGDDGATSSTKLANFCLVTPEIMELICIPMYLYCAKSDLTPAFVVLLCRNATEYSYADGRINSSNDHLVRLHQINLVGLWSVSPVYTNELCIIGVDQHSA